MSSPAAAEKPDEVVVVSPSSTPAKEWVRFEDESATSNSSSAVLKTETVQVNIEARESYGDGANHPANHPANNGAEATTVKAEPKPLQTLQTVQLGSTTVRQGFTNGDIIVTLLPVNTKWPWITPAQFRAELVPEELMAQGLTLTVEEYVQAMELLVNDVRFSLYNVCYKRILAVWIVLAFCILLGLLFSGLKGLTLFALGVAWLVFNASAIFLSMWLKFRLSRGLERCMAHVNKHLLRHKIVMALDDRGKMSCHKVNLCFLYFDAGPCIAHLQSAIDQQDRDVADGSNWEQRMDISASDIVIQGVRTTRLSRKQARAEQVFTRYLQRWGKDFLRRRLDWTLDDAADSPSSPRHLGSALCPCQYVEEILQNKQQHGDHDRNCCPCWTRFLASRGID